MKLKNKPQSIAASSTEMIQSINGGETSIATNVLSDLSRLLSLLEETITEESNEECLAPPSVVAIPSSSTRSVDSDATSTVRLPLEDFDVLTQSSLSLVQEGIADVEDSSMILSRDVVDQLQHMNDRLSTLQRRFHESTCQCTGAFCESNDLCALIRARANQRREREPGLDPPAGLDPPPAGLDPPAFVASSGTSSCDDDGAIAISIALQDQEYDDDANFATNFTNSVTTGCDDDVAIALQAQEYDDDATLRESQDKTICNFGERWRRAESRFQDLASRDADLRRQGLLQKTEYPTAASETPGSIGTEKLEQTPGIRESMASLGGQKDEIMPCALEVGSPTIRSVDELSSNDGNHDVQGENVSAGDALLCPRLTGREIVIPEATLVDEKEEHDRRQVTQELGELVDREIAGKVDQAVTKALASLMPVAEPVDVSPVENQHSRRGVLRLWRRRTNRPRISSRN